MFAERFRLTKETSMSWAVWWVLAGAGWAAVGNMNGQLDPEAEQVRAKLDTEPGMETQPGNQVEYPSRCSKAIRIVHVFMFMPNIAYRCVPEAGWRWGLRGVHQAVARPRHVRPLLGLQRLPVDTAGNLHPSTASLMVIHCDVRWSSRPSWRSTTASPPWPSTGPAWSTWFSTSHSSSQHHGS